MEDMMCSEPGNRSLAQKYHREEMLPFIEWLMTCNIILPPGCDSSMNQQPEWMITHNPELKQIKY
jgi:hypothetical protein